MAKHLSEFEILEAFFSKATLPASIKLDSGTNIPDVPLFVKNNLDALRGGQMNEVAAAGRYYRLNKLKELLSVTVTNS